jgi:transposase-like protein
MPWKTMKAEEQRLQFVIRATSGKEGLAALCREFGISRPTGYLWRRRYQEAGSFTALREVSRRPHRNPTGTAAWKEQRVAARRQETGWGAKKLQVVLREEDRLVLPVRTIHRILERQGLVADDVHAPALRRFERAAPNELWQMDTKGKYPLPQGECHPLSVLDDCSRYAVGLYALRVLNTELAWPCLVETFRTYGVPQAMLMDRGSLWWSEHNGWGLTHLSVRLIEQGIRLLMDGCAIRRGRARWSAFTAPWEPNCGIGACPRAGWNGRRGWRRSGTTTTTADPMKRWGCVARRRSISRVRAPITNTRRSGTIRPGVK